jgi:hypothetical protein
VTGAEELGWSGSLAAGTALGGIAALHARGTTRRTKYAAALPSLAYAGLAEAVGPALSGAAHLAAAALTAALLRLMLSRV